MTTASTKASLPQDIEEAGFRGVGKIRPARKPAASSAKGRPITASRSLKSISSAYNANTNRASNNDVQNEAISANLSSREELVEALFDTKKRVVILESNAASLRAENQRCENEILKQHRRIEKLLDTTAAQSHPNNLNNKISPGSAPSNEARRELEKSLLVRQLKSQIMVLRSAVAEREIEVETLKKSQKGTKIAELFNEKEEYYLETLRLNQVINELRESLKVEKQKNAWDKKRNGAGDEIRNEVARLTSGYRTILKGIAEPTNQKSTTSRSKSASVAISSKRSMTATRGRTPSPSSERNTAKMFHPSLEPLRAAKRPTTSSWRESDSDSQNGRSRSTRGESEKDELDFFTGVTDVSSDKYFNGETADDFVNRFDDINNNLAFEATEKAKDTSQVSLSAKATSKVSVELSETVSVFISKITSKNLTTGDRQIDSDISVLLSFDCLWGTEISAHIEDGSDVSLAFSERDGAHKNMLWHVNLVKLREGFLNIEAAQKTESSANNYIGAGKARITLPTAFDRESDAVVSTAGDVFVEVSLVDKNGSAAGQITFLLNLKSIAPIPYVNATVKRGTPNSIDAVAKFKVGEVVEGQFKGGVDWYGAVVKAVNIIDHAVTYHLVYDDGDEEYEMEGSKIRPFVPIPAKSPAESPAKSSSEEPQSVVLTPPSVLLYSIGDPVEALFDRGDEWYLGNVKAINAKGNFDLLYEDGDIEDDVSVGRMRVPVPPDVITVPTADNIIFSGDIPAVTESSPKNDTPVCACGREIPFGYCEECNALLEATAAKAESDRLSAEAKAAQEAATTANRSKAASRRSSLKSSEDAFLDNYLDELSDDEGGLNAGPAVYGNLASSKGSIVLKSASSDVNGGVGEYKINADDVPKSRSEKKAEEGDYNEDFES